MLWTGLVRYVNGEAKLADLAEQTAARTRHAVWDRVRWQVGSMGQAEARGYVRARSALVLNREIDRMIRREGAVRVAARARLIELTTEVLLQTVTDQVIFAAPPAVTTAAPLLRRAA